MTRGLPIMDVNSLSAARRLFLAAHNMPHDRSFWHFFFDYVGRRDVLEDPKVQKLLHWRPNRTNCPELETALLWILERVPRSTRDQLENVFAGRVLSGEANAKAWAVKDAGIV